MQGQQIEYEFSCGEYFESKMTVYEGKDTMLTSLSSIFYISKIFGIVPHSFTQFYNNKILKTSIIGNIWSIICVLVFSTQYHILTMRYSYSDGSETSTLTTAIGFFISYMGPLMMVLDIILGIVNQKKIMVLIDRFQKIDDRLMRENIFIRNVSLRNHVNVLIFLTLCGESVLMGLNFFLFQNDNTFLSVFSLGTGIPILINTLEKIWFVSLVFALKQRFYALNKYLDTTVKTYLEKRKLADSMNESENWDLGYLHKEIVLKKNTTPQITTGWKRNQKIVTVVPWDQTTPVKIFNEDKVPVPANKDPINNELGDVMKLEVKLNTLCQLHDEICEVGKALNRMWSLQMLSLMAYGFMSITAQFYFLYCGIAEQIIPTLFRSAQSKTISTIFIIYTAAKCTYVIYLSWQTKLESRKTGVCLHRIANTVDENNFYEIINHLSLKLLNHCVNFTACGFFNLDMTTLYAVTGAITSYLIILIQFNLAAHRPKAPTESVTALTTLALSATTLAP